MKTRPIFLILLLGIATSCSNTSNHSRLNLDDNSKAEQNNLIKKDFQLIHTLKKSDSTIIGYVYVKYINDSVFTDLFVLNNKDTLYTIQKNVFYNKNGIDLTVYPYDFYGYRIILMKNDNLVLSYLRNGGVNVSDDITIQWNYKSKILETIKIP